MLKLTTNKLKFSKAQFLNDLIRAFAEEVAAMTNLLYQEATSLAPKEVDRSKIEKWLIAEANQIVGKVTAGGTGALTTEWGSGTKMDLSNPALAEYQHSIYWNEARPPIGADGTGAPIVGRPEGAYLTLDDEIKYSTGAMQGRVLEWIPGLEPIPAQHWLRNLIELNRVRVMRQFVGVLEQFEAHKYFG